jgi:hypothetical protein
MAKDFVLIGCKLPHGIMLELITEPPKDRTLQNRNPAPTGPRVTLKGSNTLRTDRRMSQAQHLYATTRVPKEFWDAWIARPGNKELPFVKNGLVFVATSEADAKALMREHKDLRTGFEPLNQDLTKEQRLPKSTNPSQQVETDPAVLAVARQNEALAAEAAATAGS